MGSKGGNDDDAEPAAGPPARRYANHLAVECSLSEVEFQFGQRSGPYAAPLIHSVVVSSPVHLVTFGRAIQATIARYETRFGRIPDGSDPSSGTPQTPPAGETRQ